MAPRRNITFRASVNSIECARRRATAEQTTLNKKFNEWLDSYAAQPPVIKLTMEEYDRLMERMSYVSAGRKFTREEMNERGGR